MNDTPRDAGELLTELEALRKRVAELESCEAELVWAHDRLIDQITHEHQQTEAALRVSELKFANIFSESPDAVSISSLRRGLYVEVNPAFERVFGFARDEAVGHPVAELAVWLDPAERVRLTGLLRDTGEILDIELRFRHKSGRIFDALLSASLIEIDGEQCMMSITRDISERKRVEQLLFEQNRMLDALSRAQVDFIADARPEPVFGQLLARVMELTGSASGFIGEVLRDEQGNPRLRAFAVSDLSRDEANRARLHPFVAGNVEFRSPLATQVMANGRPVIGNDAGFFPQTEPWPNAPIGSFMGLPLLSGSKLVGVLGMAMRPGGYEESLATQVQPVTNTCAILIEAHRDQWRRREAEAQLRQLNGELEYRVARRTAELEASLKELESFSYSVSHDLRAPLRGINGFAQLLQEEFADCLGIQGGEYLKRICGATLRMSETIDDMLDLAQLTRQPMRPTLVDLSHLAEAIAREFSQAEPDRHVEFVLAKDVHAHGDEQLLRAVLENLMANAWKFTSKCAQARIEFGTVAEDDSTVYYVRDNGAGFDMKYVGKLFRAFERLHSVHEFPGTGIGLATVHRVIRRHGGNVWAEGELGKGARFSFTLPTPSDGP